jgi:PAS domain S-box-containing protein
MKLRLADLSLRWKIILGTLLAMALPSLIVGSVLYNMLSRSLLQIYRERSVQTAKDIAALVDTALQQDLYYLKTLSFDPVLINAVDSGDYAAAARKLQSIHEGIPSLDYTYLLADRNGIVRADAAFQDSVGLNISDREYFTNAKAGKTTIFGPVKARVAASSSRAREAIVMIGAPIQGKNGFSGIIGAAIRINHFMDAVSSIRIGKTGYAFLIDGAGFIIVHPDEKLILKMNIHDQLGMKKITERMTRGETGYESYVFERSEKIAGFTPIPLTGWNATFAQNKSEILAPINGILVFVVLSGCAFIALAIIFACLLSKRIATPVERMMELLQRITRQSSDLILGIGKDRKIYFANPAAEIVLGNGAQEILGMKPVLTNVHGVPEEAIWKELEDGKTWSGLFQINRNGSETLTFTAIIFPVLDHENAIQSYLEIAKDITNEVILETRLRQSQKMEALGSMAGGIAHDFNNILSGIYGFSELSLSTPGNPNETEEYIHEIMRAAERARDLTRQILTFSRQTRLELKAVYPKYIVKEALKLTRASIPPSIELRSDLRCNSVIMAEPTQIHQVIVNLCTNAVSAIGNRNGYIEVVLEDREIDEEFAKIHPGLRPGKHVFIRVADSGCGIEPAIIDRIFDPFFTTKPPGEGTGLGLSVVHGIISRMSGNISVSSEPGKGTTFYVLIPSAQAEESEINQEDSILPRGSEKVLFVDDEQPIVKTVSKNLSNLGYTVVAFMDSSEALEAFKQDPRSFDILVTDNLMPRMGGIEMAQKMRAFRSDLPVVLCSGIFSPDAESEAETAGIKELLGKPLGMYQLAAAIRRALAERGNASDPSTAP